VAIWTEALRRAEMVAAGSVLARRGLVRGVEGNMSCRLEGGEILITPGGAAKGRLTAAGLVRCVPAEPAPQGVSSEARMHFAVYRECGRVLALVHAHPAAVLALSALGRVPTPSLLREGEQLVPRIESVPPLQPGSRELAEECASALRRAPAVVLERHGVVCGGDDLWQALGRVEVLELLASIELARPGAVVSI